MSNFLVLGRRGVDSVDKLTAACEKYLGLLGIRREDLIEAAYADLLEEACSSG